MAALEAGVVAPAFSLKDLDGRPHPLAALHRNGLLLAIFYKVGCGTCQFSAPYFEKFYQAYQGYSRFQVWGICQDNASDTRSFMERYHVTFPQLLDETLWTSVDYGLTSVPTLFLIDQDGQIVYSCVGFSRSDFNAMSERVAQHLGVPAAVIVDPKDGAPEFKPG